MKTKIMNKLWFMKVFRELATIIMIFISSSGLNAVNFSGKITDNNGRGIKDVALYIYQWVGYYLPIGSATTLTDGSYSFNYNGNGTFQLAPSKTNCDFNPRSVSVSTTNSKASFTNLNFTGNCVLPSLSISISPSNPTVNSGQSISLTLTVTSNSSVVSGATISIKASTGNLSVQSGTTNNNGQFSFTYTSPKISSQQTANINVKAEKSGYNSATKDINVNISPLLPDLTIDKLESPSYGIKGGSIDINCYAKNQGQEDAGSFKVYYYLSATKIGETSVSGLLKGNTANLISVPLNIPQNISDGRYDLKAKVDGGSSIQESNENNNEKTNNINICSKKTYLISGYIKDTSNNPVNGISVKLSGISEGVTDKNGYFETYVPCNTANESYTLTPSKTGYVFSPSYISYSGVFSDKQNQNFTTISTTLLPQISGNVVDYKNMPLSNITVKLENSSGSLLKTSQTGSDGKYYFDNLENGSYVVRITPQSGRQFTSAQQVTVPPSKSSVNFTGGDTFESNESFNLAYPLELNRSYESWLFVPNDADYFSINITQLGTLKINITSLPLNAQLKLYNSSFKEVASSDNSYNMDECVTYQINNTQDTGKYYIAVMAKNPNEYNYSDSYILHIDFTSFSSVEYYPDLTVSLKDNISSLSATVGGSLILPGFNIKNIGSVKAQNFWIGFYISKDANISPSEDKLLYKKYLDGLEPAKEILLGNETVTISSDLSAGNYYLGIFADVENSVKESNEQNNFVLIPLLISNYLNPTITKQFLITPSVKPGDSFMVSIGLNPGTFPQTVFIKLRLKDSQKIEYPLETKPSHIFLSYPVNISIQSILPYNINEGTASFKIDLIGEDGSLLSTTNWIEGLKITDGKGPIIGNVKAIWQENPSAINIKATISDKSGVKKAEIFYKEQGALFGNTVPMLPIPNTSEYEANIKGFSPNSIEVVITAWDKGDNVAEFRYYFQNLKPLTQRDNEIEDQLNYLRVTPLGEGEFNDIYYSLIPANISGKGYGTYFPIFLDPLFSGAVLDGFLKDHQYLGKGFKDPEARKEIYKRILRDVLSEYEFQREISDNIIIEYSAEAVKFIGKTSEAISFLNNIFKAINSNSDIKVEIVREGFRILIPQGKRREELQRLASIFSQLKGKPVFANYTGIVKAFEEIFNKGLLLADGIIIVGNIIDKSFYLNNNLENIALRAELLKKIQDSEPIFAQAVADVTNFSWINFAAEKWLDISGYLADIAIYASDLSSWAAIGVGGAIISVKDFLEIVEDLKLLIGMANIYKKIEYSLSYDNLTIQEKAELQRYAKILTYYYFTFIEKIREKCSVQLADIMKSLWDGNKMAAWNNYYSKIPSRKSEIIHEILTEAKITSDSQNTLSASILPLNKTSITFENLILHLDEDSIIPTGYVCEVNVKKENMSAIQPQITNFSFIDAYQINLKDGILRSATLSIKGQGNKICYYQNSSCQILDTKCTFDGCSINILTPGIYALINQFSSDGLSAVQIYPVPFNPCDDNPDNGKPYQSGDPDSGIIFNNLPSAWRIVILDINWTPVITREGTEPRWRWDGLVNGKVKTGLYLVTIEDKIARKVKRTTIVIKCGKGNLL